MEPAPPPFEAQESGDLQFDSAFKKQQSTFVGANPLRSGDVWDLGTVERRVKVEGRAPTDKIMVLRRRGRVAGLFANADETDRVAGLFANADETDRRPARSRSASSSLASAPSHSERARTPSTRSTAVAT